MQRNKKDSINITNLEYTKTKKFLALCEEHGIIPTTRQASKFRNKRGILYILDNQLS